VPGVYTDGFTLFHGSRSFDPAINDYSDDASGPVAQSGYSSTQSEFVGDSSFSPRLSDFDDGGDDFGGDSGDDSGGYSGPIDGGFGSDGSIRSDPGSSLANDYDGLADGSSGPIGNTKIDAISGGLTSSQIAAANAEGQSLADSISYYENGTAQAVSDDAATVSASSASSQTFSILDLSGEAKGINTNVAPQ